MHVHYGGFSFVPPPPSPRSISFVNSAEPLFLTSCAAVVETSAAVPSRGILWDGPTLQTMAFELWHLSGRGRERGRVMIEELGEM